MDLLPGRRARFELVKTRLNDSPFNGPGPELAIESVELVRALYPVRGMSQESISRDRAAVSLYV